MNASWNVHDPTPRLDDVHHGHDGSNDGIVSFTQGGLF